MEFPPLRPLSKEDDPSPKAAGGYGSDAADGSRTARTCQGSSTGAPEDAKLLKFFAPRVGHVAAYFSVHGLWLELSRTFRAMVVALQCHEIPCSWCQTRLLGPVAPSDSCGHQCMVAMGAAICQLHHRYELQALGSMFNLNNKASSPEAALAPSFEAWLNDVHDDEFVLPAPNHRGM